MQGRSMVRSLAETGILKTVADAFVWVIVGLTSFLVLTVIATQMVSSNINTSVADASATWMFFLAELGSMVTFLVVYLYPALVPGTVAQMVISPEAAQIIASISDFLINLFLLILSVVACWSVTNRTCDTIQWQFIVAFLVLHIVAQIVRFSILLYLYLNNIQSYSLLAGNSSSGSAKTASKSAQAPLILKLSDR